MENNALNEGMSKLNNIQKDIFKQRGGTVALAILVIVAIVLAFNAAAILAWATSIFKIATIFLGLGFIFWVLTDKNVRLMVSAWYVIQVQKVLGILVRIDPVSICREKIKQMQKKITKIETVMGTLNGKIKGLAVKIEEKKRLCSDSLAEQKAAEKRKNVDAYNLAGRQAVRMKDLAQDYIELHASTEKWYKVLSKMAEKAQFTIDDATNELDAKEEKYNIVKLSHSTFKSAMSVIKGDPDELAMYNQAFNFINEDIMDKIGEMDRVLNQGGMLDKIDIENDVMALKGSDLMKKYDELGIDALFEKMDAKPASKSMDIFSNPQSNTPNQQSGEQQKYF